MRSTSVVLVLLAACGGAPALPALAPPATKVPLFEGTGAWTRTSGAKVPEAQRYFDQGLAFLYAFNHDEAIRSFTRAAELDPTCAMAHWGIALANGPHINNPDVDDAHAKAATEAVARARSLASGARPVDRALIEALGKRYASPQPKDRKPLDEAYAAAMRDVARAYPTDADVGALFAEAMMDLRPWNQWHDDGTPQPGTEEILAALDAVTARAPGHPLANHLTIHAVEASPAPEKADAAANRLRDLTPGLGHNVHMPSHIDVRRGRWREAITANERAVVADRKYLGVAALPGFYSVYVAHNHHMLAYAAMMVGESERAVRGITGMLDTIPKEVLDDPQMTSVMDGFLAGPLEVRLRFGRWDEVLAAPAIGARFPIATALQHHARGVAHAAKGDLAEAVKEQALFLAAKAAVPKDARFGNNTAADLLAVAERMLAGELAARAGKLDEAVVNLREAVTREDALRYDEPPDWILPVRHALGATLLRAKRAADAEAVYREDLRRLPENGWALLGLARSLEARGQSKDAADARARFAKVWASADVKLSSSCFCQPGE